jgi:DNA-binding response OmpR family regulator
MSSRLLVVEDERHLAAGLKLNLELEGHHVDLAGSLREAAAAMARPEPYALIVLDLSLPDGDGLDLCRRLRAAGNFTPVIMLTARGRAPDRVAGLEAGADDYLPKPFELDELLARVRSQLRRSSWSTQATPGDRVLRFGRAVVDFDRHEVRIDDHLVHLTHLELELLRYLAERPGRVVSRDELIDQVWKVRDNSSGRTVDNFVLRLRRHFEKDPTHPVHFLSVRGAGYKFLPEGETA